MEIRLTKGYSTNELYKGDTLGLSRLGGYYCFNILERNDKDLSVRDLTNIQNILFVVQGEKQTIEIPETLHKDIDRSIGQVLFKFTKENADNIFNAGTNNYYICSKVDDIYSVIYNGQFIEGDTISELSDTITSLNEQLSELENEREDIILNYTSQLNSLNDQLEAERLKNENLMAQINQLKDELAEVNASFIQANIINEYTPT